MSLHSDVCNTLIPREQRFVAAIDISASNIQRADIVKGVKYLLDPFGKVTSPGALVVYSR